MRSRAEICSRIRFQFNPIRLQRFKATGDHPARLERGEAGPQPYRPPLCQVKNRRRKLIEVFENLKQLLSPFARESGSVMPRKKLQLAFANAAKRAGISPWPQNGLRHCFCSYAVAVKGFEWTSMQADHSVQMLRKHYREVVDRETAERYWAIRP